MTHTGFNTVALGSNYEYSLGIATKCGTLVMKTN